MRKRILIVDDDKHTQELVALFLGQDGYETHVCQDGYSAIDEISNKAYDLVILDISMPHLNGLKVLKQIKQDKNLKDLPVVMLTGSTNKEDVATAGHLGAMGYLLKPPKKSDLLQRVKGILGESTQVEELIVPDGIAESHGSSELPIQLHRLSREGMTLSGPIPLSEGFVFSNLNIPIINDLNLNQKNFILEKHHKTEDGIYHYHISFLDLNQQDRKIILDQIKHGSLTRKSVA